MSRRSRLASLCTVVLLVATAFLLYPILNLEASSSVPPAPKTPPLADEAFALAPWPDHVWDLVTPVQKNETLSGILKRAGMSKALPGLMQADRKVRAFRRLRQGQRVHANHDPEIGLYHLMLRTGALEELHFRRTPDGKYTAERRQLEAEYRPRWYRSTIRNNLFVAGQEAGLSAQSIMNLAEIFGWDIDFALDIRSGDHFEVLLEEQFVRGKPTGNHSILATEFVNRGKTYRAFRFTTSDGRTGYYDASGSPMRKQFLRTPVDFTRISSHFSHSRLHPIHKVYRPHRGVDYAAPKGTPVYASGDGTVLHKGYRKGYGETVTLRHGSQITTLYAHLSGYARGLRVGKRVLQKQVIGYVGATGDATGPHLHYEFRVAGIHRNPLKVRHRQAQPLPNQERRKFTREISPLVAQMDATDGPPPAHAQGADPSGSGSDAQES